MAVRNSVLTGDLSWRGTKSVGEFGGERERFAFPTFQAGHGL